ncbi:hypothetical protein SARC_16737, partial [Sphaeroforma arctica JP610]
MAARLCQGSPEQMLGLISSKEFYRLHQYITCTKDALTIKVPGCVTMATTTYAHVLSIMCTGKIATDLIYQKLVEASAECVGARGSLFAQAVQQVPQMLAANA